MHFHFLLALAAAASGQPVVEITPPELTAHVVKGDVRNLPENHFYLIQQARRIDDGNREAYFARLDGYLARTVDCSNPEKIGRFLEMAYQTHPVPQVRAVVAPSVNMLILEQPACFLSGVERVSMMADPRRVLDRFVVRSETADPEVLQAALRPLLSQPEFVPLAEIHEELMLARARQLEREEGERQRRLAMERRAHRQPLLDAAFLDSSPAGYWSLWNDVSGKARGCEDIEAVADLLDAAVMHAKNDMNHRRSAEFVEMLVIDDPACVLNSMTMMRNVYAFERYLLQPLLFSPGELLTALASADVAGEAEANRRRAVRLLDEQRRDRLSNMKADARFLQGVAIAYGDNSGRLFIAPAGTDDVDDETLEALWAKGTPAGTHSEWSRETRELPLEALDFLTQGQYPAYQMLWIDEGGVTSTKARPVGAAILEWFCEGKLLVLKLASEPPMKGGDFTWWRPVVLTLNEDLPLPEVSEFRHVSEEWFTYGRLSWPSAGRSVDFKYSDSFTEIMLELKDRQTGETRDASQTGWSCH